MENYQSNLLGKFIKFSNKNSIQKNKTQKYKFSKLAEILRYKIQHFLTYFQNYLYHNAIENAWNFLISKSKKSISFVELCQVIFFQTKYISLLKVHENFLDTLLKRTFLSSQKNNNISESLNNIILFIQEFHGIVKEIVVKKQKNNLDCLYYKLWNII